MCGKYCIILSCSFIPHFFFVHCTFPPIFCLQIKLFDILVLTWIGSAPPHPSRSAHLFVINAGVPRCAELVLIWLLNLKDQIKVIQLLPWPLFPHMNSPNHGKHFSAVNLNHNICVTTNKNHFNIFALKVWIFGENLDPRLHEKRRLQRWYLANTYVSSWMCCTR
jgi:hypothetical protein